MRQSERPTDPGDHNRMRLTRRAILTGLTVAGLWPWPRRATAGAGAKPAAWILAGLTDRDRAAAIGRACLVQGAAAGSTADLVDVLRQRLRLPPGPGTSTALLKRRIAERCRQDFLDQDVVDVGGWRLARTEAALCALAARSGQPE